jgi:hypothetical protein
MLNGLLPVVRKMRRVAEGWSGLVDDVASAEAGATGGFPSTVAVDLVSVAGFARRAIQAAGDDAKVVMTACACDPPPREKTDAELMEEEEGEKDPNAPRKKETIELEAKAAADGIVDAATATANKITALAASLKDAVADPTAGDDQDVEFFLDPEDAVPTPKSPADVQALTAAARALQIAMRDVFDDLAEDVRDASLVTRDAMPELPEEAAIEVGSDSGQALDEGGGESDDDDEGGGGGVIPAFGAKAKKDAKGNLVKKKKGGGDDDEEEEEEEDVVAMAKLRRARMAAQARRDLGEAAIAAMRDAETTAKEVIESAMRDAGAAMFAALDAEDTRWRRLPHPPCPGVVHLGVAAAAAAAAAAALPEEDKDVEDEWEADSVNGIGVQVRSGYTSPHTTASAW